MAFNENDHPRAKDGKFAPKGSGTATGGAKQETPKKNLDSNIKDLQQKRKEAIKNYNRTGDDKYSNEERELEKQINGLKDRKVDQLSGKEIEIDDDYERSYGPAPDREDDPKGYEKYIKSYKKWKENGDSFDGVDDDDENEHFEIINKIEKTNLPEKKKKYFYDQLELIENYDSDVYDNVAQLLDDLENEVIDYNDRKKASKLFGVDL